MDIEKLASILLKRPPTNKTRLAREVDGEWCFCAVGCLLVECGMEPEKISALDEEAKSSAHWGVNSYYHEVWLRTGDCLRTCGLDSANEMANLMLVNDNTQVMEPDERVRRIIAELIYYTEGNLLPPLSDK
jgi:hypothetical protein